MRRHFRAILPASRERIFCQSASSILRLIPLVMGKGIDWLPVLPATAFSESIITC